MGDEFKDSKIDDFAQRLASTWGVSMGQWSEDFRLLKALDADRTKLAAAEARIAELDPKDDKTTPHLFYRPYMKAAEAALALAHKKVSEITGYSGGSGNWSAQEDDTRIRFALEHLQKGDCSRTDDDRVSLARALQKESEGNAATYRKALDLWVDAAEKAEAQLATLRAAAKRFLDCCGEPQYETRKEAMDAWEALAKVLAETET